VYRYGGLIGSSKQLINRQKSQLIAHQDAGLHKHRRQVSKQLGEAVASASGNVWSSVSQKGK